MMRLPKCPVKKCHRELANGETMCSAHWRRIRNTPTERKIMAARAAWFATETMTQSRDAKSHLELCNQEAIAQAGQYERV